MTTLVRPSIFLILFIAATSFSRVDAQQTTSTEDDVAAISKVFDNILLAAAAGEVDRLMAYFTCDAVWMFGDQWTDVGKTEAAAAYGQFFEWATPDLEHYRITVDEVLVTDEWAYVRSTHKGKVIEKDSGESVDQGSRHVSLFRRQADGSWKIARDVFINPPLDKP